MPCTEVSIRRLLGALAALALASACASSSTPADSGVDGGLHGAGAVCDSGFDCNAGSCLGGRCCAQLCTVDKDHPECTTCDSAGACNYPQVQCSAPGCDPAASVAVGAGVCQAGTCSAGASSACAPYGCAGELCAQTCAGDQDCAPGYQCAGAGSDAGGSCARKQGGGSYCVHDDDCGSGSCLHNVCCSGPCLFDPANPECTVCDSAGACQYPNVTCQQSGCDSQTNSFLATASCSLESLADAGQACPAAATQACGEYQCGAVGCGTACLASTDCIAGAFCLTIDNQGQCCPGLSSTTPIYVDILAGNDTGCCGSSPQTPCQTMATALSRVQLARASGQGNLEQFTLSLSVGGAGGNWTTANPASTHNETWPVILIDGVTIHAPGVYLSSFVLPGTPGLPPATGPLPDRVRAVIEGAPGNPVYVGVYQNAQLWVPVTGTDPVGLNFTGTPSTLSVANAEVWGLESTGVVNLGIDSQRQFGLVKIGSFALNGAAVVAPSPGLKISGGVLSDFGPPGTTALQIENIQTTSVGLYLSNSSATLTHNPIIGRAVVVDGGSPAKGKLPYSGGVGVEVGYQADLTLQNATVQGWAQAGVLLDVSQGVLNDGAPDAGFNVARIDHSVFTQNGCSGLDVQAGNAYVSNTDFDENYVGVNQEFVAVAFNAQLQTLWQGQVDLSHNSDGGASSGNRVFCNTSSWRSSACVAPAVAPGTYFAAPPEIGVGVQNRTSLALPADGVAWDQAQPQLLTCGTDVSDTACDVAGGPFDGGLADAVIARPDLFILPLGTLSLIHPAAPVQAVCP